MLSSFFDLFNSQEKLNEKWVFLLIFLFPIAGPVVRHWNSGLFVLITFTALYFLFTKKDRKPLFKEEKIYLWVFVLFFVVYIVSVLVNGYNWERIQKEGLGTEIGFLLFVPIYLLIREYRFSQKALFAGILLSIPIIFVFSLYEYIYILPTSKTHTLTGAYSQLFIGPIVALSLLMSFHAYKEWQHNNKNNYWLISIYILMGLFIISFSYSRLAYLTIFFGTIFIVILATKNFKKIVLSIPLIFLIMLSIYQIDSIKNRTDTAFNNLNQYFQENNSLDDRAASSLGLRLEVWRSSQYIFKERPLIGIGNGNYPNVIKKYIDEGLVGKPVHIMGHTHNTFFEALINKGSIGLILLLMIFYYPTYLAWQKRQSSPVAFLTVATFSAAITLMSIGESALIIRNNAIAYLLLFSAVLFSSLMQKIKN